MLRMSDSKGPLLRTVNVSRDYPLAGESVHAVRDVSLDVHDGEYCAIVGPSGCGKSSLLNLLGAIDRPSSGAVELRGKDVSGMSDRQATDFRLRNIGFVFQRFYLRPMLSASENVELPMAEAGVGKHERRARAAALLSYVGLGVRARHQPGWHRRLDRLCDPPLVAIARAGSYRAQRFQGRALGLTATVAK